MRLSERCTRWWREVLWLAKGVLGADAYERYLAHHYGSRCDHEPMDERAFWRARMAEQEVNPGARCC